MARARTVAVVVPSPATSLVLDATSWTRLVAVRHARTICGATHRAPRFSNLSLRVIDLATVTPSGTVSAGMAKARLGHTFGDFWATKRLFNDDVSAFGAQCHLNGVGQHVDALENTGAAVVRELDLLVRPTGEFGSLGCCAPEGSS